MKILVLPISGGRFVTQLASIIVSCKDNNTEICNLNPDIIFAASGGNLTAYIVESARWNINWIYSVASRVSSKMFISNWSSSNIISTLIGYFKGNYYNYGIGVKHLIDEYFTSETIQLREIWTGTFNKTKGKIAAFCNKSSSILDTSVNDHYITCSLPVIFNSGNIEAIVKSSTASASIPSFVPPQIIDGEEHQDCGVFSASPLIIFEKSLKQYHKTHLDEPIHLFYFNSVNLDSRNDYTIINLVDNLENTIQNLVNSKYIDDRKICYSLFELFSQSNETVETDIDDLLNEISQKTDFKFQTVRLISGSYNKLTYEKISKLQEKSKYSFIEVYPKDLIEINIKNFDGNDVVFGINTAKNILLFKLWILF